MECKFLVYYVVQERGWGISKIIGGIMQYVPTAQKLSDVPRRVIAGAMAIAIIASILLSTINSAVVYAGSEAELLATETTALEQTETNTQNEASQTATVEETSTETEAPATEEVPVETQTTTPQKSVKTKAVVDVCVDDLAQIESSAIEQCEDEKTLREIVDETPTTSTLSYALSVLDEYDCEVVDLFDMKLEDNLTVFAPSNTAFESLVRLPDSSMDELSELLSHPDELCELISYHIHSGEIFAADVPSSAVIDTFAKDDSLQVKKNAQGVFIDQAQVIVADVEAANGVAHIIDDVLLPQEAGTIDQVVTNSSSPALSGNIILDMAPVGEAFEYCVVVRVDGIPYEATVTGSSWKIAKNVVTLDPFKEDTLFDIVVRNCSEDYTNYRSSEWEQTNELVGLTMVRDIVSYKQKPVVDETDDGKVLGETTDKTTVAVEDTYSFAYSAGSACGKGICSATANQATNTASDPDTTDSDGDGVVDSKDSEPNNPDVTGQEEKSDTKTDEPKDETTEDSSQAFWWFIGGGGIALLWYLLWQRGGKESL